MKNNKVQIKRMFGIVVGIWLAILIAFAVPAIREGSVSLVHMCVYGVLNLFLFSAAYLIISKKVTKIMERVDDSIQSLIDGYPVRNFFEEEESLLGKFQMSLMKLYRILCSSQEREERLRKEMSSLVADLVHQINTPLTNLQIYSDFLMQDGLLEEEKEHICKIIQNQIEKLDWFADGFSKTARLEEDMRKMNPGYQAVLSMILSAIDEISVKAQKHGNEISLSGEQDIEAWFDRRWTEEAVFNLLDNAVKYSDADSIIQVRMAAYEIYVRIDVINEGEPVSEEEYTSVFNRYYRGKNATFIKEGVGLGLYLTRQIAAAQGGYVKVASYHGKGSVFSLFLLKNPKGRKVF